jgi:hypothetical protein
LLYSFDPRVKLGYKQCTIDEKFYYCVYLTKPLPLVPNIPWVLYPLFYDYYILALAPEYGYEILDGVDYNAIFPPDSYISGLFPSPQQNVFLIIAGVLGIGLTITTGHDDYVMTYRVNPANPYIEVRGLLSIYLISSQHIRNF